MILSNIAVSMAWFIGYIASFGGVVYAQVKDKHFVTWLISMVSAIMCCAGSCVAILG